MGLGQGILWAITLAALAVPQGSGKEKKKKAEEMAATITDQKDNAVSIRDPRCVRNKRSLFGDSEEVVRHFAFQRGEGTETIEFKMIKTLSVTKVEGKWLRVKVEFHTGKTAERRLKSDLAIRGETEHGEYELKMVALKKITFSMEKKKGDKGG